MNTFTKTLIASAMAVAVAGTASANPKFLGVYSGGKTTLKITPSGCPNASAKNQTTVVAFTPAIEEVIGENIVFDVNIPFSGCWAMTGIGAIIDPDLEDAISGTYIERKVGKDLTMAATLFSIEEIVDAMDFHLVTEGKCDVSLAAVEVGTQGVQSSTVTLKKGNGKLSKNGDRVKVDIQIDAKYKNGKSQEKNIKAKINGKMDYSVGVNPVTCFDAIVLECNDDVCID